jgi:hypothetical protein
MEVRRPTADDGDRIDYRYVGSIRFLQQDNNAHDIVFSISDDADFVAERLSLYPSVRFNTSDVTANGPPEIVSRPCIFSFYEGAFMGAEQTRINYDAACVNRAYQNTPFPAQVMFSGAVNYKSTGYRIAAFGAVDVTFDRYYADFEFPSAMLFPTDWYLPAGSDFQIKISPNFSSIRSDPAGAAGDATLQNEYEITAVLEGYKKVRR